MDTKEGTNLDDVPMPLPEEGHYIIVDFWSSVFASTGQVNNEVLNSLARKTIKYLQAIGYELENPIKPDGTIQLPSRSLSGGILGIGRPMIVFRNTHAKAFIYMKLFAGYTYVSLRLVYPRPFSEYKGLFFGLIVLALTLSYKGVAILMDYTFAYLCCVSQPRIEDFWYIVSRHGFSSPDEFFFVGIVCAISLFVFWGLSSWNRTGLFLGFLREDMQEVYRDDLATIGHAAYNAIMMSADELSLKVIAPDDPHAPAFGAVGESSRIRRQTRI